MRLPVISRLVLGLVAASSLYLGATGAHAQTYLFDFGGNGTQMEPGDDPLRSWNNVPASIGTVVGAQLLNAVSTNGTSTSITLTIDQRFNGDNANGTIT